MDKFEWLRRIRWREVGKKVFSFVGGAFFGGAIGLLCAPLITPFLPGPKLESWIVPLKAESGSPKGGMFYQLTIHVTEEVDDLTLKIQLPWKINNYKIGYPQESVNQNGKRTWLQIWAANTNSNGLPIVHSAAVDQTLDIQSESGGNMISMHASKVPKKAFIFGFIATTEGVSTVTPPPPIFSEGKIEYTKLGSKVEKTFQVPVWQQKEMK